MSSAQETIDAITAFYRQVIRQPYLEESALKIPPPSGWDNIDADRLRALGKDDMVIELLRHLPYLGTDKEYERLLVGNYTVPIDYTARWSDVEEQVTPLPGHCVYLTEGVGREGYALILDTRRGTITAYSIAGYQIVPEAMANYDDIPRAEQWQAHRTLSAAELLDSWSRNYARLVDMLVPGIRGSSTTGNYYSRVNGYREAERLAQDTGPFEEWQPDMQQFVPNVKDEDFQRLWWARGQLVADLYNCFLRHGWPDAFDKQACRAEAIELQKQLAMKEKQFSDANNPDAALFDD